MSALKRRAWLLLAATLTLQIVITRSARVLSHDKNLFAASGLDKRSDNHAVHQSLFPFPYAEWYEEASETAKPFIIMGLLAILGFLFSFIGITASDFFCPNLSSIASFLGLNESTAGVTFLAFGNGSPDVFSTFAALKGGTFGLAIGELIGAASFIVSVVVGTIAFIRPFHVPRQAFLRDVLFFTSAVILLVIVLRDGRLTLPESLAMVTLYVLYVIVVVVGNWVNRKRKHKQPTPRLAFTSPQVSPESNGGRSSLPRLTIPDPILHTPSDPIDLSRHSSRSESPGTITPSSPNKIRPGRFLPSSRIHNLTPIPDDLSIDTPRANFSLLGAVEFRDVVNSLRRENGLGSSGNSPARSPHARRHEADDYFGAGATASGHRRSISVAARGHKKASRQGRPRAVSHIGAVGDSAEASSSSNVTPVPLPEPNPWTDQAGHPPRSKPKTWPQTQNLSPDVFSPHRHSEPTPGVPSIAVVDPSGSEAPVSAPEAPLRPGESRFRIRRRTGLILRVLFPSLQSFRHKSYLGMFLAVVCVPSILALTLTLPVVDDGGTDSGGVALPTAEDEPLNEPGVDHEVEDDSGDDEDDRDDRLLRPEVGEELHHLVDHHFSPLHSPLGRISHSAMRRQLEAVEARGETGIDEDDEEQKEIWDEIEEDEALDFNKYLTAAQCLFGTAWSTTIIFRGTAYFWWILLGTSIAGAVGAIAVLLYATDGSSSTWRLVRCFAGFVCSMVWIAAIADEVVGVLQAVGVILGLSDAIVGLTIFAVGNSLADLVANVTVAQFAPAMAYAACFGGPMLNLLLGVGGSGTYHMLTHPSTAVTIHFSPTLWVSASGLVIVLVGTAIIVPLNGYLIDRRWASCLLVCYTVLMVVNIVVEIKTGR